MKKLYIMLLTLVAAFTFTGCSESNDPFFTAGEDDFPRILNTDIPEMSGGQPSNLPSISRDQNFTFTAIVTPTRYTTVSWYIDGEKVSEGNTINMPMLAGNYNVKIVATTTKGKETSRNCTLAVLPLEGDPSLSADVKARWMNPGAKAAIPGTNIRNVTALYIGGKQVSDFVNSGTSVSFAVPELPEGDYKMVVETAEGKFGVGTAKVTKEKYVEPGVQEVPLWEGSAVVNWGDSKVDITAEQLADVPVGAVIKLYYNVPEAEYHAMRITTPKWGDTPEDNLVAQFDITGETANPYEFVYTEACKKLVEERGGMLITGFGYEVTKVSYDKVVAARETTVWEGDVTINWGDSNVSIPTADLAGVKVGSKVCLYFEMIDAEYHAMRVTTPKWGDNAADNLVAQFDLMADTPNPYEFEYTDACKKLVDEREGMLVVGFGYKLKKITVK